MLCVASLLKMWSKVPSHDALFPWASTGSLHVFCCGFAACYHPELAVIQDGFEKDCCASCNINTGRTFYLGRESTITTMSAMKRERSPANVLETEHAVCKPSISHWTCCFARFSQEDNSLVGHPLPLHVFTQSTTPTTETVFSWNLFMDQIAQEWLSVNDSKCHCSCFCLPFAPVGQWHLSDLGPLLREIVRCVETNCKKVLLLISMGLTQVWIFGSP